MSTALDNRISDAKSVRIEHELVQRGIVLKRQGGELIGPCPVCGGTDRFGVSINKQVWHCRGCQKGGDVITLVQHIDRCDFQQAIATLTGEERRSPQQGITSPLAGRTQHEDRARIACWLWEQSRPITEDTPPARYLRGPRRVTCPLPATLRYLPANNRYPDAMIAAFGLATEVEPGVIKPPDVINGVHLTRLTRDGHKAPDPSTGKAKIMIGSCIGAPIVLAPPNDLLGLTISEGVEDALTLAQALGIGAWAAGSAGFMPGLALLVPSYIEQVTVYQDDDQAGRANATELARALEVRGFDVRIEQGVNR